MRARKFSFLLTRSYEREGAAVTTAMQLATAAHGTDEESSAVSIAMATSIAMAKADRIPNA